MLSAPSFVERGWRAWSWAFVNCLAWCSVIAWLLSAFNEQTFLMSLWVSLGFGISIMVMVNGVYRWLPNGSEPTNNLIALLLGFALGVVNLVVVIWVSDANALAKMNVRMWAGNVVVSFFICLAAYYFFYTRYRMQTLHAEVLARQAQAAERERLLAQSELKRLQSQIEPHFLFNTLANIQGLVDLDPLKAKHMIGALTQMLRMNLQRSRATQTTLAEEFEMVRCYLEIQAIRMGERLHFTLNLPTELQDQPVPPLVLQPLVENAIMHGFEQSTRTGELQVSAGVQDQQLHLTVSDNGVGIDSNAQRAGIGLSNIRARLEAAYGDRAVLNLQSQQPHGTLAEIRMPIHD